MILYIYISFSGSFVSYVTFKSKMKKSWFSCAVCNKRFTFLLFWKKYFVSELFISLMWVLERVCVCIFVHRCLQINKIYKILNIYLKKKLQLFAVTPFCPSNVLAQTYICICPLMFDHYCLHVQFDEHITTLLLKQLKTYVVFKLNKYQYATKIFVYISQQFIKKIFNVTELPCVRQCSPLPAPHLHFDTKFVRLLPRRNIINAEIW